MEGILPLRTVPHGGASADEQDRWDAPVATSVSYSIGQKGDTPEPTYNPPNPFLTRFLDAAELEAQIAETGMAEEDWEILPDAAAYTVLDTFHEQGYLSEGEYVDAVTAAIDESLDAARHHLEYMPEEPPLLYQMMQGLKADGVRGVYDAVRGNDSREKDENRDAETGGGEDTVFEVKSVRTPDTTGFPVVNYSPPNPPPNNRCGGDGGGGDDPSDTSAAWKTVAAALGASMVGAAALAADPVQERIEDVKNAAYEAVLGEAVEHLPPEMVLDLAVDYGGETRLQGNVTFTEHASAGQYDMFVNEFMQSRDLPNVTTPPAYLVGVDNNHLLIGFEEVPELDETVEDDAYVNVSVRPLLEEETGEPFTVTEKGSEDAVVQLYLLEAVEAVEEPEPVEEDQVTSRGKEILGISPEHPIWDVYNITPRDVLTVRDGGIVLKSPVGENIDGAGSTRNSLESGSASDPVERRDNPDPEGDEGNDSLTRWVWPPPNSAAEEENGETEEADEETFAERWDMPDRRDWHSLDAFSGEWHRETVDVHERQAGECEDENGETEHYFIVYDGDDTFYGWEDDVYTPHHWGWNPDQQQHWNETTEEGSVEKDAFELAVLDESHTFSANGQEFEYKLVVQVNDFTDNTNNEGATSVTEDEGEEEDWYSCSLYHMARGS